MILLTKVQLLNNIVTTQRFQVLTCICLLKICLLGHDIIAKNSLMGSVGYVKKGHKAKSLNHLYVVSQCIQPDMSKIYPNPIRIS